MNCPRCGCQNITYQREQTGNIGVRTNTVLIQEQKRSKGCLYWILIGWWWKPLYYVCFGWWWGFLFGRKKKGGFNIHANKSINTTVAVCQNCGHSWKVS